MKKYYRKPHQYRKKKQFFYKKLLFFVFLALIVLGSVFYGLFIWKAFWVEKIVIDGEENVAEAEIAFLAQKGVQNKALFLDTKSIWAINTGGIREDILSAFPRIASAEVKKSFFNALNIQIKERTAAALWCESEHCFLIDDHGVIFEEAPIDSELAVIETLQSPDEVFLGKTIVAREKIAQILDIQTKLIQSLNLSIKKAVLVSNERLDVETIEGWLVRFNLKNNLDQQITELKLVLKEQISLEKRKNLEYIDLRFSRVYYK